MRFFSVLFLVVVVCAILWGPTFFYKIADIFKFIAKLLKLVHFKGVL